MAAAALAAAVVTLFRRVTRWLALTAPREIEWECCRWAGLGSGRERDNSCADRGHIISMGTPRPKKFPRPFSRQDEGHTLNEAMVKDFLAIDRFFESP